MEYTHTHTHIYIYTPMSKVKTTQQKYSILMWQTKEIKKLYLPVENSLTKAQSGKQN